MTMCYNAQADEGVHDGTAIHHLPGVPSAEQIAKEGVDLVRMNALLLAKVEELTLYSVGQEKINQQQQAQLDEQQYKIDQLEKLVHQLLEKK
ncbi:hypothetical protein GO730_10370 [Spirosoma sp. HMF3257]|uniref:SlyX family protein n=1 Tax=Spirosoma telluris TaxID=2183553 RepID=A0A327NJK3_9BACT|nr:hypothetical protein [Spirosoma telluris]RAI74559.1 hypothetical protein HMF3257_10280 [Spirosoma telluris]